MKRRKRLHKRLSQRPVTHPVRTRPGGNGAGARTESESRTDQVGSGNSGNSGFETRDAPISDNRKLGARKTPHKRPLTNRAALEPVTAVTAASSGAGVTAETPASSADSAAENRSPRSRGTESSSARAEDGMVPRVSQRQTPRTPTIDQVLADQRLLGAALGRDLSSWSMWRVVLKSAFGIELNRDEARAFSQVAGSRAPPAKRVRELWCIIGRRGGKSRMAALIAVYCALFMPHQAAPGERLLVLVLSASLDQSKAVFSYCLAFLEIVRSVTPRDC